VFAGYWRRPELAASEFTGDGFFRTGDLGCLDGDGYLRIAGRSKDLVISGAERLPAEVEEVIDALDGVLESAVIGVPDPDLGEAVVAVVTAEPGKLLNEDGCGRPPAATRPVQGAQAGARDRRPPRNAMGKVEKARLRSRFCQT